MVETYVLDSFAILALLKGEVGGEQVSQLLQRAREGKARVLMTWVNVGEVAYIVERRWGKERAYQVLATLEATGLEIIPVGQELALKAAGIKAAYPLAYADTFAAALAMGTGAVLVTGDPEFEQLEGSVRIQWLSQAE